MSAYADLIPGSSPSRRRSAYDDLLPKSAPAAPGGPAEDARPAGDEAATMPRVADAAREVVDEMVAASRPARAVATRRGGLKVLPREDFGPRVDGTRKGLGYFGLLKDSKGRHATEISVGVDFDGTEREIPSLVPTLTRSEVDHLLAGNKPSEAIMAKAVAHARERFAAGKDAFAQVGEQGDLPSAPWGEVASSVLPAAGAQIRNAVANLRRMANEESIRNREMVLEPQTPPAGTALPHMVRRALERQQALLDRERAEREVIERDAAAAREDLAAVTPQDMSTVQQAVHSAVTSAPTTLAGLAAGIAARNPALGMAIAGGGGAAVQAGSTYGEAREKGAGHDMAKFAALGDAAIEGLDALPVGVALKRGSAFAKRILKTAVVEATTEAGQQLLQDLRSMAMENPGLTLGELWQNFKVAVLAGGMGGTVYGGLGAAANAGRKDAAPMHEEDAGAPPPAEAQPKAAETPAPPVEAPASPPVEKPEVAPPNPYADLIPGADPDGRIEPTLEETPRQPEPWEEPQASAATEPLTVADQRVQSTLKDMAEREAGWAEIGGRLIRHKHSEVQGDETITRTKWIPKADWWKDRPGSLNEAQTREAVRKAIAGEKLSKREQAAVEYMVEIANERIAERQAMGDAEWSAVAEDLKAEGAQPSHEDVVEVDLVARASELNPDAVEAAAVKYENDDAAFMAEVRRIIGEHEAKDQDAGAARGGEANRGAPAQGEAPALQLDTYTEADLAARERAAREAEARRKAEEEAAERKRVADSQVKDFVLTGSERAADVNPQQGNLFSGRSRGMPAGTAVATAGSVSVPPSTTTVGKDQARPDAIRAAMRSLFGAPLNEKNISKKYLGIYRIKPQTIRLQNRNDLRTAAHEIGHHISNLNRGFRKVMRQHEPELIRIAPRAYIVQAMQKYGSMQAALANGDTRRLLIEEGFAEFIAEYLTAPTTLQAKVPSFYAAFETWLGQNPNYAQALQQVQDMVGAHQALPAAEKILAKVGTFKPTLGQRAATLASRDTWDTFAQSVLDKWHPLKAMVEDLMPGMAASKNPYLAARLLAGDAAIIEDWISDFTTPFDYAKRLDGKNYGKPLKKILEPLLDPKAKGSEFDQYLKGLGNGGKAETLDNFKAYLIARRAAELMKVGKENLFTKEEIADALKLETPLFRKVAEEIYAYNDRLVDYAVEGGLLAPEVAAKFKQYANYIPFFREPDGDAKGGGRGDPFKRLRGGTANLRDPIANLIQNTASIIHATNRNAMVKKAAELAKAVPGGGRWLETVKLPQEAHTLSTQRILEELQKQGLEIDQDTAKDLAAIQTFFTPSGKGDERTRTIVYKDGGQLRAVQVNDPLLWKTLGNIPPLQMGLIGKLIAFPAQTLRAGVVLDPTFMVRNFVRDTLSATVQSKGAFIPVVSTAQGIKMMAQQRDAYRLWRAFGGAFSDQFRDPEESQRTIERMAKRGGFAASSIITPTRWLDALRRVGSFTESGSRVGEFAATYKPGDIDSALQAALNAREVSTDFGMRGGSEAIQVLTRITPFMNPAMQGLYKTARVLSGGDGKAAAAKALILGTNMALVSMALALINSDEDWYQRIEEWEKTTYWHFKVGENVYRIPKPFEYGTLFASMPEAMVLRAAGQEGGEDFKKRMLQSLGHVFGFRVIPQVAALVGEPWANKSIFTGRQIVPDRQERLEPGLQSTPNTSKVAQVAGEAANVSPAVIDNVVRNMFGTLGVHATTVADLMLEQTGAFPAGRERGWQTWPALKAFVRDPDNPNSKQQRDFYEALERYRRAVNTVKEMRNRGEDAKADRYAEERADDIAAAKGAEAAARRLSRIRKRVRAIEWDRDMSPPDKRQAIREHNDEMQGIVEEHTPLYQAAKNLYSRRASEGGR